MKFIDNNEWNLGMCEAHIFIMSSSPKLSPRKKQASPKKVTPIASVVDGDSNATIEARVTSVSTCRPFGDGPDNVFLHMSLMDSSGSFLT